MKNRRAFSFVQRHLRGPVPVLLPITFAVDDVRAWPTRYRTKQLRADQRRNSPAFCEMDRETSQISQWSIEPSVDLFANARASEIFVLQTSDFRLQTSDFRLRTSNFRLSSSTTHSNTRFTFL